MRDRILAHLNLFLKLRRSSPLSNKGWTFYLFFFIQIFIHLSVSSFLSFSAIKYCMIMNDFIHFFVICNPESSLENVSDFISLVSFKMKNSCICNHIALKSLPFFPKLKATLAYLHPFNIICGYSLLIASLWLH